MKRCKDLEYPWILKGAFTVSAYTVKCNNGKKYVVYAHDFNDMEWFLTRIDLNCGGLATRTVDKETHFERRIDKSYIPDKNGEPRQKPFWHRGRVYEIHN